MKFAVVGIPMCTKVSDHVASVKEYANTVMTYTTTTGFLTEEGDEGNGGSRYHMRDAESSFSA